MNPITVPSALTDVERSTMDCLRLADRGFKVVWFQVQNDTTVKDRSFAGVLAAAMEPGVWGVTYHPDNFYRDGLVLAKQAVKLGAKHLMMDAEEALKNTHPRGAANIILGARDGGWSGPVHLTTLGAPATDADDYGFDLESFLVTGGGIFLQCYAQATSRYAPGVTVPYFQARGVPRERMNVMIWTDQTITAQTQVDLVRAAGLGPALSIFMAEMLDDRPDYLTTLAEITKPVPVPDARLTLDPLLPTLRDMAGAYAAQATAKDPAKWIAANPNEIDRLTKKLVYEVLFGQPSPVPLDMSTNRGKQGAALLAAAGRLARVTP